MNNKDLLMCNSRYKVQNSRLTMQEKVLFFLCTFLVVAQLVVVLVSWVWSAAMPESSVRSLLSPAGIRWFFGSFVTNLASPFLVWIVLLDIAIGICVGSGLWKCICQRFPFGKSGGGRDWDYQQKTGLNAVLVLFVIEITVWVLLTFPRHAVLLSITGNLFPSSFSVSIVPVVAFIIASLSFCYGLFGGLLHNYQEVVRCACRGGNWLKSVLIVYVLAMELYCSVVYVLA